MALRDATGYIVGEPDKRSNRSALPLIADDPLLPVFNDGFGHHDTLLVSHAFSFRGSSELAAPGAV